MILFAVTFSGVVFRHTKYYYRIIYDRTMKLLQTSVWVNMTKVSGEI